MDEPRVEAVEAELGFRRDDAYLREHYRQWLLHRSGWRRWIWLASLLLGVIATVLAFSVSSQTVRLPAVIVAAAGFAQGVVPWIEFRRWKRAALGGLDTMPDLRLSLDRGVLRFGAGPNVRYDARGECIPVPGGCFLYEHGSSGRHAYLPDRWLRQPDTQALFDAWQRQVSHGDR